MKTYRVYQVDSFTTEKFRGNPAGVVANADGLTEAQMQTIARELNNSETAFVLSPTAPDHDMWVRFFTPTVEVPTCGHATVAAHYILAREKNLPSCTVIQKIGAGILPVEIIREDGDYRIIMTQGKIEYSEPLAQPECDDIIAALGLTAAERDPRCPIQIVSTGHSKVMIGIHSRAALNTLKPDLTRLAAISRRIGCNGHYVFTLDSDTPDILAHGRMFAPAIGIAEDPVTGNANGPLGAYLLHNRIVTANGPIFAFRAQQGEAIGRTGIVEVEVHLEAGIPVTVRIGGRAVTCFETVIEW
ncbi:MAG TPA: PhzF family isomerase [Phototrophicaceae bacterium]|nr:PhzF family isomerase [Phototrophicaceae bacterium]